MAAAVGVILSISLDPIHYMLIAEDNIGGYCTAVSFVLSGFLMVTLLIKCGTRLQKRLLLERNGAAPIFQV